MSGVDQSGTFALGDLHVRRLGFGAMQLSGPNVFGPPKDRTVALSVLREAVASGVNHIDTSLAQDGIAYVPFFPLGGGFTQLQSSIVSDGAQRLAATPAQIAIAWLYIHANTRAIFGRSYAAEPDVLVKELAGDQAIKAADTLLLTIPNQLGVDYNAHVLESILKYVAPELGWR